MTALIPELRQALVGLPLTHLVITRPRTYVLTFARHQRLLLCCEPPFTRFHLVRKQYPSQHDPFSTALEEQLVGCQLTSITLLNEDRILALDFRAADRPQQLVAELLPKRPNLMLLDASQQIIKTLRPAQGNYYQVPPKPTYEPKTAPPITSQEVEQRYTDLLANEELEQARHRVVQHAKRQITRLKKGIAKLQIQLEEAEKWEGVFHEAQLLQANFHLLKPGLTEIEVIDWIDNSPRRLVLQPKLKAAEQVAARFKRVRRLKGVLQHLPVQLEARENEIAKWQAVRQQAEAATALAELPAIAPPKSKPKGAIRTGFRRFVTADGLEILVGRNDRENDQLTFKVARGSDWWLHAHDYPGAHVVIRVSRGQAPSQESLQDALQVAAHFSRAADNKVVDVCVTQRKYLQRPKQGRRGQVWMSKHQVISVRVNQERWQAISLRSH